jgi:putative transposase
MDIAHPGRAVYPYLLRELDITEANLMWATDITYIPMAKGFCYLVAVIDEVAERYYHGIYQKR